MVRIHTRILTIEGSTLGINPAQLRSHTQILLLLGLVFASARFGVVGNFLAKQSEATKHSWYLPEQFQIETGSIKFGWSPRLHLWMMMFTMHNHLLHMPNNFNMLILVYYNFLVHVLLLDIVGYIQLFFINLLFIEIIWMFWMASLGVYEIVHCFSCVIWLCQFKRESRKVTIFIAFTFFTWLTFP